MTPADDEITPAAEPSLDLEAHLAMCVRWFEEAEDNSNEARASSEQCRDYYNGIQLTADELKAFRLRKQAPVVDNLIQRKVDTLCGIERRTRTDPKAFPRNPDDEQTAEAATDSLRFVADQNRFNAVRSEVFNDILVEGTGACEIIVEPAGNDFKIVTKRVPWDRFWYDPHSRQLDFSDAMYLGIVIWSDATEVRREYPDRVEAVENTFGSFSTTYEDRPRYTWCDSARKRVRKVQCHYLYEGQWWVATYTKGGFLVDPVVSPYKDKDGASCCSIIARSGFVDRENNRFGHTKGLLSLQDEINKRRSKALHLMSVRQTFGNKSALQDTTAAKRELAKPDGHVELNGGAKFGDDFGILPTGDMAQGQVLMLEQALQSMNASGANAALQGKDERAQSGRALQARAQMGATELEPQTDGLREWTHKCYEAMWMRVRQFWTEEKWVRVTDDDRNMKFVGLNKPVTLGEKIAKIQKMAQSQDPAIAQKAQQMADKVTQIAMQLSQQMMLPPNDPRLMQEVVERENDVSGLDVDIVVEDGPDIASIQGEQFEVLAGLAQAGLPIPPEAIIEASSLRNKDKILDRMEKAQAAQAEAQKKAAQLAEQSEGAKTAKTAAEVGKTEAQTRQIEVETHTTGMAAMQNALMPQQPPMVQ